MNGSWQLKRDRMMLIVRVKPYLENRETLLIYIASADPSWKFITALP